MTSVQSTGDAARVPPQYGTAFWAILAGILLFSVVVKLPTLRFPRNEPDEQVYLTLAKQLHVGKPYTIAETPIVYDLSPHIYDRPLFFHPPLFPALIVPFIHWERQSLAITVSWLGHLLAIVAVALIGRQLASTGAAEPHAFTLAQWLPVVGVACDPLLTFVSRRLWIDSLLVGCCAMSVAAFFVARNSPRRSLWLVLGGTIFGLAALSKITAVVLLPLVLYLTFTPATRERSVLRDAACAFIPILLFALPWYVTFYRTYGMWVPTWIKPDEWTLSRYAFMRATMERTPGFYLWTLATIAPAAVLGVGAFCVRRKLWTNPLFVVGPIWFALWLGALSYLGWTGSGFQMRYIAPATPSVYLMLYAAVDGARPARDYLSVLALLLVLFGGITSSIYLVSPRFDEIYSLFELARLFAAAS